MSLSQRTFLYILIAMTGFCCMGIEEFIYIYIYIYYIHPELRIEDCCFSLEKGAGSL